MADAGAFGWQIGRQAWMAWHSRHTEEQYDTWAGNFDTKASLGRRADQEVRQPTGIANTLIHHTLSIHCARISDVTSRFDAHCLGCTVLAATC